MSGCSYTYRSTFSYVFLKKDTNLPIVFFFPKELQGCFAASIAVLTQSFASHLARCFPGSRCASSVFTGQNPALSTTRQMVMLYPWLLYNESEKSVSLWFTIHDLGSTMKCFWTLLFIACIDVVRTLFPLTFRCQGKLSNYNPCAEPKCYPSAFSLIPLCKAWFLCLLSCLLSSCGVSRRCVSCCSSAAKGSCGCRSGSCRLLSERRRRSYGTWPPWCWLENRAPVTSCTGEIWRSSIRGEDDPAGEFLEGLSIVSKNSSFP